MTRLPPEANDVSKPCESYRVTAMPPLAADPKEVPATHTRPR